MNTNYDKACKANENFTAKQKTKTYKSSVSGFPRIGANRELKWGLEKFFSGKIGENDLKELAKELRLKHWNEQKAAGIDYIASNDFSFYDQLLDTAVLFNIVPDRYKALRLSELETYFALARGYQGSAGDVKALAMKKWFNTNYHYMVPEIDDTTKIELNTGDFDEANALNKTTHLKALDEFLEAKSYGIQTKPVLIGPFTLLKLCKYKGKKDASSYAKDLASAYASLILKLGKAGADWIQLDEPFLVNDLSNDDISLFKALYEIILPVKRENKNLKLLLNTYFGDVRDIYSELINLDFDAIGLDFIEGKQTASLIETYGFPSDKTLFAGLVNGKNIWRNNYDKTLKRIKSLEDKNISLVISTSCSLLHLPYSVESESKLSCDVKKAFAFAKEKLGELSDLKLLASSLSYESESLYLNNVHLLKSRANVNDSAVQSRLAKVKEEDFTRLPEFDKREKVQKTRLALAKFPTTTIGSFPQTSDVKKTRKAFRNGEISLEDYKKFNKEKIAEWIKIQEDLDIDMLVHGEFERNDMVEYFGSHLKGYVFTQNAWVQSYGSRCVKPPIIWGDISRSAPITVEWSQYAQSLTKKPVKGMLTGPVTILNWSFTREDISPRESAIQIALAIRDEVLDLEAAGIKVIQIDEAALREKLPLRKSDWDKDYLDWAIPAFRLVHSGVAADTQIHTHMCYSEFTDIIPAIDAMDADVITFEASRSDLQILNSLAKNNFRTEVGPGVYDIHSPRVPSVEEITAVLEKMLKYVNPDKLWVNPDCGLKTRDLPETIASLKNLVLAAKALRQKQEIVE